MASDEVKKPRRPPATTVEARENQLINLAYDEAEKQIREGRASSQTLTHFLKLGTVREKLEREKLRQENLLLEARTDQIGDEKKMEELMSEAIRAMSQYKGVDDS